MPLNRLVYRRPSGHRTLQFEGACGTEFLQTSVEDFANLVEVFVCFVTQAKYLKVTVECGMNER